MKFPPFSVLCSILLALAVLAAPSASSTEIRFDEGYWRLELSGLTGIHSGSTDRTGDFMITGTIDYEFPVHSHATIGLRLLPLFVYDQKQHDDPDLIDNNLQGNDSTIWGGGFGLATHIFSVKDEYRGWFLVGEACLIGHANQIAGNNSNINFLLGAGVGYQTKNNWHAAFKFNHISNSSLTAYNAGTNGIGLGIGYRF